MVDAANTLLQQFQKQKVSQENEILQTAQRLVNQFRSLRFLRESFVEEYNAQLLASSPDVRRFLTSLMGGNEVRNYLEFLEKQSPQQTENNEDSKQTQISSDGYLPSPDNDLESEKNVSSGAVSLAEFEQMKEQQKILMEQTQQLLKRLNQQGASSSGSSTVGRYSEIIEDS